MSAETYLGCTQITKDQTPYADWTSAQIALNFIQRFGGIDGAHHKDWVLDMVARILNGAEMEFRKREWTDHEPEYDIIVGESKQYLEWVDMVRGPWIEDEDYTGWEYGYNEGIAP